MYGVLLAVFPVITLDYISDKKTVISAKSKKIIAVSLASVSLVD